MIPIQPLCNFRRSVQTIALALCVGLTTTSNLLSQSVVESLDTRKVDLWPRWQVEPKFECSWLTEELAPRRVADTAQLSSSVISERVEEARRLLLISGYDDLQGGEEALRLLLQKLQTPPTNRMELLAYLSGAMAIGTIDIAPQLWAAGQSDVAAQAAVEKWLIEIGSDLAVPTWRERLSLAVEQNEAFLTAIEGLGVVGESSDAAALQQIIVAESSYLSTQLVAAMALGRLMDGGLESFASDLVDSGSPMGELLAARALASHSSAEAGKIAERILTLEQSAAHANAFQILIASDAERARLAAKNGLLKHPESTVRQLAVEHLANLDDADALRALGFSMRDVNPETRRTARAAMQRAFAINPEARQFVVDATGFYLKGDFAFGAEQAIVLAVALDFKQFCPQLVNLLEHPDAIVNVRAAWALQELADDEQILQRLMPLAKRITGELAGNDHRVDDGRVTLLSMLFGAFGRNAYMPANEMLLQYVPKNSHKMRDESRAAAIWALGRIWTGRENASLASQLAKRMLDDSPDDPENKIVKYTSTLALGMIRDPASPRRIAQVVESVPSPLGYAAEWAIEQYRAPE